MVELCMWTGSGAIIGLFISIGTYPPGETNPRPPKMAIIVDCICGIILLVNIIAIGPLVLHTFLISSEWQEWFESPLWVIAFMYLIIGSMWIFFFGSWAIIGILTWGTKGLLQNDL